MAETIVVADRFKGPPNSGNGGYVAGLLARRLRGTAAVTLRKPVPLDQPLTIDAHPARIDLLHGETLIARAEPGELAIAPPEPIGPDEARDAQSRVAPVESLAPTCFGCGPARAEGDGLHNRVVRVRDTVAAGVLRTPPDLDDGHGRTPPEVLWAALDCPGGWSLGIFGALGEDRFPALVRMTAALPGGARPGQELVALAWPLPSPAERPEGGTALFDADGELLGLAHLVHAALPLAWLRGHTGA